MPPFHPAAVRKIQQAATILAVISAVVLIIACGNLGESPVGPGRGEDEGDRNPPGSRGKPLAVDSSTADRERHGGGSRQGGRPADRHSGARFAYGRDAPSMFSHSAVRMELDHAVLAYNFAISILTGIIFGLVPALRSTNPNLANDLKERTGQAAHTGRWSPRALLVMAQVAFSVVALVGAGLFVRSLRNTMQFDPGFDAAHLGIVMFNVADHHGYRPAQGREFQRRAPGESAGGARGWRRPCRTIGPSTFRCRARHVARRGSDSGNQILSEFVWPGFLGNSGHTLAPASRDFNEGDSQTSPHVVIVNQDAANLYWPGEDPLGKPVRLFGNRRFRGNWSGPRRQLPGNRGKAPAVRPIFPCSNIIPRRRCLPFAPPAIPAPYWPRCVAKFSRSTARCCCCKP